MRRQFFLFTSGDPQYSYHRPQGLGGFYVADLLQEAESWAIRDRSVVISELQLAKALSKWQGALSSLGVNSSALISRVAELEGPILEDFCFVLMPFRDDLTVVYRGAIKPAVEAVGLRCERADEIKAPGVVRDQIDDRTQRARVILADLTGSNPNVTHELGFARALGKQIVLLTQEAKELPFDLQLYRVLKYEPDTAGLEILQEQLRLPLAEILH